MNTVLKNYIKKLKPVKSRIREIWLFGSRARGDYRPGSDYDLLIVADKRDKRLLDAVYSAVSDIELEELSYVSAKVFPYDKYKMLKKLRTPFLMNVMKEGVRLV